MDAIELISQDLFDKVRSRYSKLEMGDENGNVTSDPRKARFFDFDFSIEGNKVGRVSISINERGSLKVFYGQGILDDADSIVQELWFKFLREMRNFAKRRLLRFDTRDITKSNLDKTDFQYLASAGTKEETMSESKMFGSTKSSYLPLEKTRLIIRHNKAVDETQRGARSRNINAMYIENAEGERFKYPFIHLSGAKAMQRHVANGGRPYDECGQAIIGMSEQIAQLTAFKRHVGRHDSMHTEANDIMERAYTKLESLRNQVHNLSKQSHYESWKESYHPTVGSDEEMVMDQATMEDYKAKFTVSTFQEDLTQYFPLLYSIMRESGEVSLDEYVGEAKDDEYCDSCDRPADDCVCDDDTEVKEFSQFLNWADAVTEGRLTDDVVAQLKDITDTGLTLGVDGVSAIEALQGIGIEDNDLFAALEQLAKVNPDADPSPTIGAWLAKFDPEAASQLGLEAPEDTAEPAASGEPGEPEVPANPESDANAYADADAEAYGTMESDEELDEISKTQLRNYSVAKGVIDASKYDKHFTDKQKQQSAHRQSKGDTGVDSMFSMKPKSEGVPSKNTDVADKREKLAKAGATTREIPKGTDFADKKEKLAKASSSGKKGPFHNIGKGLKAFVTGKEEPIDEEPENTGTSLLAIAEMVKSYYDRNTKKFPIGKTGVVTKVRKELGDHAGKLAERLCNELSPDLETEASEDPHKVITDKLSDIERRSKPVDDDAYAQHIERMKQQKQEYLKKNPHSIYKAEDNAFEDILRLSGLKK